MHIMRAYSLMKVLGETVFEFAINIINLDKIGKLCASLNLIVSQCDLFIYCSLLLIVTVSCESELWKTFKLDISLVLTLLVCCLNVSIRRSVTPRSEGLVLTGWECCTRLGGKSVGGILVGDCLSLLALSQLSVLWKYLCQFRIAYMGHDSWFIGLELKIRVKVNGMWVVKHQEFYEGWRE